MSTNFDAHAAGYREAVERSTSFSGKGLDFFTAVKVRLLLELISRHVGGSAGWEQLLPCPCLLSRSMLAAEP